MRATNAARADGIPNEFERGEISTLYKMEPRLKKRIGHLER